MFRVNERAEIFETRRKARKARKQLFTFFKEPSALFTVLIEERNLAACVAAMNSREDSTI